MIPVGLLAIGPFGLVAFALVGLVGAVLSAIDLVVHRLPDWLVLPLYPVLTGLFLTASAVSGDWGRLGRALLAMVVIGVIFFVLALSRRDGLGLGDVKLAGALGLFLGWFGWPEALAGVLVALVLNGLASGAALLLRRRRTGETAFGPWLVLGSLVGASCAPYLLGWLT